MGGRASVPPLPTTRDVEGEAQPFCLGMMENQECIERLATKELGHVQADPETTGYGHLHG